MLLSVIGKVTLTPLKWEEEEVKPIVKHLLSVAKGECPFYWHGGEEQMLHGLYCSTGRR